MSNSLRKPDGTFAPGWRGGGRPPGARNKLTEVALQALGEDFERYGAEAIAKVRREKTHVYLQIVASLLPRQVQVEKASPLNDLTDTELDMLEQHLVEARAKLVHQLDKKIEKLNGDAAPIEIEPQQHDDIKPE